MYAVHVLDNLDMRLPTYYEQLNTTDRYGVTSYITFILRSDEDPQKRIAQWRLTASAAFNAMLDEVLVKEVGRKLLGQDQQRP